METIEQTHSNCGLNLVVHSSLQMVDEEEMGHLDNLSVVSHMYM